MADPVRPYYSGKGASALYYDLLTAADRKLAGDIEIYAGLAKSGDAVLELGAGTGRIAIALAERGLTVTGLDISPAMLAQAQAKRDALDAQTAERLRFVQGDMAALALGTRFDLVLATYFALAHIPTGMAWRNTFQGVAAHLRDGGLAAFHLPLLENMAKPPPPPDQPVFREALEGGRHLTLFVTEHRFNPKIGRMDLVLDYVTTARTGAVEWKSREKLTYYMADPAPYATAVGLIPVGAPIDVGGMGAIHVFRKGG